MEIYSANLIISYTSLPCAGQHWQQQHVSISALSDKLRNGLPAEITSPPLHMLITGTGAHPTLEMVQRYVKMNCSPSDAASGKEGAACGLSQGKVLQHNNMPLCLSASDRAVRVSLALLAASRGTSVGLMRMACQHWMAAQGKRGAPQQSWRSCRSGCRGML